MAPDPRSCPCFPASEALNETQAKGQGPRRKLGGGGGSPRGSGVGPAPSPVPLLARLGHVGSIRLRGGAVRYLAGLINQRSRVQIPSPRPESRSEYTCQLCWAAANTADHIQPLEFGGQPFAPANLRAASRRRNAAGARRAVVRCGGQATWCFVCLPLRLTGGSARSDPD